MPVQKIILTGILLVFGWLVWTRDVDLIGFFKGLSGGVIKDKEGFNVRFRTTMRGDTDKYCALTIVATNNSESVNYPVWMGVFLQLTSEEERPLLVDSFKIEVEAFDGTWTTVPDISPHLGTLHFGYFNDTNIVEFGEPFLEDALWNKNVPPKETVQGWLLLEAPLKAMKAQTPKEPYTGHFRMVIRDSRGRELTSPIDFAEGGPDAAMRSGVQNVKLAPIKSHVDISANRIQYRSH